MVQSVVITDCTGISDNLVCFLTTKNAWVDLEECQAALSVGSNLVSDWFRLGMDFTSVAATRLDDFGPTFASVLCSLGHALPGHLVGVIGGAHCDLVLHRSQQRQVGGP